MNFAELHLQVVRGRSGGRIIWQPRIGCWLGDKLFNGEELPLFKNSPAVNEMYRQLLDKPPLIRLAEPLHFLLAAIYRDLGCSVRIYDYNATFKRIEDPSVKIRTRRLNETDLETIIETPVGKQTSVQRHCSSTPAKIWLKREITTEAEIKAATWRAERTAWQWDQRAFEQIRRDWDDLGAPTMFMPRVNIQDLYINTMGVENAIYALFDCTKTVEKYFQALNECHNRLMDVINSCPIEIINFGDNLHGGTLSPELFKKYVLPAYQQRCRCLHKAGKFVHSHWDGDTKSLLPFAQQTGLDGIEAITPKPQGDVTLEEIKEALGDKMFLIDGIPAILFDKTYPVSMLEDCTHRLIELFAPRLILGISDEISSRGDIERVRVVGEIVADYNARMARAILRNREKKRGE